MARRHLSRRALRRPSGLDVVRRVRLALLAGLLAPCAGDVAAAAARPGACEDAFWSWATKGVGQLVSSDLSGAVVSLTRARGSCPSPERPELDALVGLVALAGGRTQDAVKQLESAVAGGAATPGILYWAGRAALARGRRAAALRRFEQAVAVGGDRPELRMAEALTLAAKGRRDEAVKALLAAAARQPALLDPTLYPSPEEGAIRLLSEVLLGFPALTQLRRTQGHLLWQAGKPRAALDIFRRALASGPDDADALQMAGRCLAALGVPGEGLSLAERALALAPEQPAARALRGELLLERGEPARAIEDLRRAADALPRDAALLLLTARACSAAGQTECARSYYHHAIQRDSSLAPAHAGLGLLELESGRLEAAGQALARAVTLDPSDPRAYLGAAQLARLRGEAGRAERLRTEAERLTKITSRLDDELTAARRLTALHLAALRELERAAPGCDEACASALAALPPVARSFMRAHLDLRQGRRAAAARVAATLLPRLRISRLLLRDPTKHMVGFRPLAGPPQQLRRRLPFLSPSLLR